MTDPIGNFSNHVFGYDVNSYASIVAFEETAMVEKVVFLSTFVADRGTVTASSEVSTLPAINLLDQEPSRVWRSTSAVEQHLDFSLKSAIPMNAAALTWPSGTLSSGAQMRGEVYATAGDMAAGTNKVLDTDWMSVWPQGYMHNDPDWGFDHTLMQFDNVEAYRYFRLRLTDPGENVFWLDVGRATVGVATQFKLNPAFDGGIGFVPIDVQEPNGYGQIFTDPRPYQQRQFELVWSALADKGVRDDAMELTRLRGQAGDLFVFLDPGDRLYFHQKSMQAVFEGQHKFQPQATWIQDTDGQARMGWAFTLTLTQKL